MTRGIALALFSIALALGGCASLVAGLHERALAGAQADMAALDLEASSARYRSARSQLETMPWPPSAVAREIETGLLALSYWLAEYRPLAARSSQGDTGADPGTQLRAANALYREAQSGPQDRVTLLRNLDAAVRAYAEALRLGVEAPEAAFNYELVVRLRAELAAGRRRRLPEPASGEPIPGGRMHGVPGGPPDGNLDREFLVRIPRDAHGMEQSPAEAAGTGFMIRKPG